MAITKQKLQVLIEAHNKTGAAFGEISKDADKALGSGSKGLAGLATGAQVAMGAAVAGVAALGASIAASITTAADFQQTMAGVQATLGEEGTAGVMEDLTGLAKEMGKSTAFSASEAAKGMKFLAQAGFDTDEIMSALPETLDLAAAGNLDLGEAADIASNVLSGMRLETDDLSGVVDGLAAAASNSNTDVRQMGAAFAQVAPGAAAAGVSFEETAAALGVLADNGIQAGAGGTALNAALRTMIKPSREAEEAAKRLGLTFTDATGQVRPMADIVQELEEKNISAKDALVLFGEEGGRAINALVGSGSQRLRTLQDSIENSGGAAKKMADVQMNTFEGAMKTLGSATEGLMITVGEKFLPILQTLIEDHVVPAITSFNEFIDSVGGLGQMFTDAVDLVAGFGKTYLTLIDTFFSDSTFRTSYIENIVGMFSEALELVATWGVDFGKLIGTIAELLWEPISFAFGLIWEPIKTTAVSGINAAGEAIEIGINAIIDKVNTVAGALGVELERVDFTPIAVDAPRSIEERYAEMKTNVAARWEEVGAAATKMSDDLTRDTEAVGTAAENVFVQIGSVVDEHTKEIAAKYKSNVTVAIVEASEKAGTAGGEAVVEESSAALQTTEAKESYARRGEKLGEWFGAGLVRSAKSKTKDLGNMLRVPDMASSIGDVFGGAGDMANTIGDKFGGALSAGLDIAQSDDKLKAAATALGGVVGGIIGGPAGAMIGQLAGEALGKLGAIFGSKGRAESRKDVIGEIFESVGQGDLANFAAFNNLKRTLDNAGSARMTAQAIASSFGIEYDQAVDLINIFRTLKGGRDKLSEKQERLLAEFNALLGADEAEAQLARAQKSLVKSATGFSGMVSKPTMFLAGEEGPEHVQINPGGSIGGGSMGGMSFTFNINAIDSAGVAAFIERQAMPMILDGIRDRSRRGEGIIHDNGIIPDRRV